jgi:hypothetical protein
LSALSGKSTYGKKELIFALGYSQSYTTNVSASPAGPRASATSSNCSNATRVWPSRLLRTVRLELRDLERAIAKMPDEQRSVILLVGLEGMSYEEAASVVNLPVGTVRSRVSRGRETLRMMTELFPSRHSRRPVNAANLDSRRRQAPHGNHFESRSRQMLQ